MEEKVKKKKSILKFVLFGGLLLVLGGIAFAWYIFNDKFTDMRKRDASFTVNAMDLIKEFQVSDSLANAKYAEKIMTVKGRVTELENFDSTINLKIIDTLTDAYIIFAFQQENVADVKKIKEGDSISIKGSCSGGTYSDILETEFINFKRCVINK
jgi:hypothetical protein